jgi:predicted SprT family Zn-dependent metalloprotease
MGAKKEKVTITVYTCERCGHRWTPRNPFDPINQDDLPKTCVACKNTLWNTPRTKNERRRTKPE